MVTETRLSRELDTRAKTTRKQSWAPPELLPAPNPEPGFAYRWIRVSTLNVADPMNLSAKRREGWEPVKASEHPELHFFSDADSVASKDTVVVGGLMLCKTPVEFVQQRNDHYLKQANDQMIAVDNNLMRQSDPRMPLFNEKKSSTTFGSGK
jgi:hypothetical protein